MMGTTMMGIVGVWMLLMPVGLIVLSVWLIRLLFPQAEQPAEPASDIVRKRLAKGEISLEEFESLQRELS